MKIFMIARGYPSPKDPQWGCFEKDQAEALQKVGHEVVMVCMDTRFRTFWRSIGITRKRVNGVVVYNQFFIPGRFVQLFFGDAINNRWKEWQWKRVFRCAYKERGRPDLIYAHYMWNIKYGVQVNKQYQLPLVGVEHWSEMGKEIVQPFVVELARNTYPYVNQLVTVSDSLRNNIKKWVGNDALVVHNMIGKEFTYQPNNTPHPLTFVTTGSLIHRKGFDLLIEALHRVNSQLPEGWQCNIIGGGEKKVELQQQIDQTQLQEHIHLVGQKNKQEIVQLLQQSDVFVLPSRGENFSVAVLEALACGLPVIASICGGIRECVEEHNGLLFPVDDTEALANAILHMATHLSNYDRQAIAADCQARFSPEVIARKLTDIFDKVLADNAIQ